MQRRALLRWTAGAATTALAGCSAFADGPPEPTHDLGVSDVTSGPTLHDGVLYVTTGPMDGDVGSAERSLLGVDLETGEPVVTVPGAVRSFHPPVVTDDSAIVCGGVCKRLSFESETIWRTPLRDRFDGGVSVRQPMPRPGQVEFGVYSGQFVALDWTDGSVNWTADIGSQPLANWDGNAWATVASTSTGSTVVLDPADGTVLVRRSFEDAVAPTVRSDGVVLGGSTTYFVGRNLQTQWTYPLGQPSVFHPVSDDGTIYLASVNDNSGSGPGWDRGILAAVDRADGAERWRTEISGGVYSSPAVADDGRLAVGTIRSEELVVLSPDGTVRDRWALEGQVTGPVRTDGERFVALTEEGSIYVVE